MRDKFWDLARELKTNMAREGEDDGDTNYKWCTWNIPEGLVNALEVLEIRRQVDTIQTIALLWSARILRRVLETWGDLMSFKLHWKTIS